MKHVKLNLAQRVVVVVGLAVVFDALANWTMAIGSHPLTGWVAFAPLSQNASAALLGGFHPWVRLVIFLAYALVWLGCSLLVLRDTSTGRDEG
jgi:hypothetical protein